LILFKKRKKNLVTRINKLYDLNLCW